MGRARLWSTSQTRPAGSRSGNSRTERVRWGWTSLTHVQFNLNHGCTSDLEGFSEDQPCEHPHQGVPGNRVERDNLVSSAPCRVPDSHSAETLVPAPQPRGAELRDRERVRVRKESLRRAVR